MNPYLALAACLRAGLDGIEKQMKLPECVQGNMFIMAPECLEKRGVERIPETLGDAIEAFEHEMCIRDRNRGLDCREHRYPKELRYCVGIETEAVSYTHLERCWRL